jgi:hypothetical protein
MRNSAALPPIHTLALLLIPFGHRKIPSKTGFFSSLLASKTTQAYPFA